MKNALYHHQRRGFTLVEIMIVVAIVALLAAVAVPNFLRARKRAQAVRIYEDLRILDYSLDAWALEQNKSPGDVATFANLRPYLKDGSNLSTQGADLFGNPYGPFTVDQVRVPQAAFRALSDVAPASFWSPFNH